MHESTATTPWPVGRGSRDRVAARFGAGRADLAHLALTTGDPLADAVADEIAAGGRRVRVALQEGITRGLASLADPPPAVAALLADTETPPDGADDALLDRASLSAFDAPQAARIIALTAGSLVRTYESPSIAEVLKLSGRLLDAVPRRLEDTGRWYLTALLPGSLRPGEAGYTATLQVRVLHAHMRAMARRRGYDEAALGVPINQVDLVRTWMDFTLTSHNALDAMGYHSSAADRADQYRYWHHVAHLLGIDPRLLDGVRDQASAREADDLLQAVTGPPGPDSAALAEATLRSTAATLHEVASIPGAVGLPALYALARRFHGDARADALGLPRAAVAGAVLDAAAALNRVRGRRLLRDPRRLGAVRARNVAATRAHLARTARPATHARGGDPDRPVPAEHRTGEERP
ncbi:oxygenase MpaB family protein [Nocardiopsis sp. NPDC006139]|uniref:oxygenase MpaB family protein n=1 Tax=unclassified Nocardiopsis TaxID=2649073 RepID=UPI0033B2858A